MQKIRDFLNSEKTFYQVLDILDKHGDMSKVGQNFVAGGSVANTLYHLFYGVKLVINDIDYYKEVKHQDAGDSSSWYSGVFVNEEGLEIFDDNYGRTYVTESGASMRVIRHSRDGIFNKVEYLHNPAFGIKKYLKSKEQVVLEGFDLNCCKAGLDMVNGKIIYTEDFVRFLATRQMEVINPCAPIQTTIRIYKKIQELEGIYCDLEHEIRFLTVAAKKFPSGFGPISKIIGLETKIKYDKFGFFVGKYFKLHKLEEKDNDTLKYGNSKNKPKPNVWTYEPVLDFDIVEYCSTINVLKKIWNLLYRYKKKGQQDKINKIFYKNAFLGKKNEDNWTVKIQTDWNVSDEVTPCYYSNRFTYNMILTNNNYYNCDFDLKHVDFLDGFIFEHPNMSTLLIKINTLIEQYKVVKFIKSVTKKEGDWVIGILESTDWYLHEGPITNEVLSSLLQREKVSKSVKLIEPLDLSGFEYKSYFKELTTQLELIDRSKKFGNRYDSSFRPGTSRRYEQELRIFHVVNKGVGSMLTIYNPNKRIFCEKKYRYYNVKEVHRLQDFEHCILTLDDDSNKEVKVIDFSYRICQHSGRGLSTPTKENIMLVEKLVEYMNSYCLPKNQYISKLDLFNVFDSLAD